MKGPMRLQEFSARVVTFKIAAALEQYEMDLRQLAATWLDTALHQRLQEELAQLRMYCASIPRLSVPWVAVLVSRARLLQSWGTRTASGRTPMLNHRLLQEHLAAVESLRKRCLRMMGAQSVPIA